jgi:hypothetical protein
MRQPARAGCRMFSDELSCCWFDILMQFDDTSISVGGKRRENAEKKPWLIDAL